MRSVTENISDKEHRWATRELQVAVDAIPATATGTGLVHVTGGVQDAASKLIDTADINPDQVTYAKIQNVSASSRLLGRITAGAGDIEELTGTQATTLLDPFSSTLQGVAPASGGGTANFLRADGAWAAPPTSTTGIYLVSTITAPTAWDWTGLNGDASGLVEYRIVINVKRAVLAGFTLGVRINNDSGANYRIGGGALATSVTAAAVGGAATNNLAQGTIVIPAPLSGSMRLIDGTAVMGTDDTPQRFVAGDYGFWTSTAAITRLGIAVTAGAVDAGSTAILYRVVSQ